MTGSLSSASDITSLDEYNVREPLTYEKPFSAWPKACSANGTERGKAHGFCVREPLNSHMSCMISCCNPHRLAVALR